MTNSCNNGLPALGGGTRTFTGGRGWCCFIYQAGAVLASLLIRLWMDKMCVSAKNGSFLV